jgi:hypothetical protein
MSTPTTSRYLEPTQTSGRAFVQRRRDGEVIMLNLLRFRSVADYSAHPEMAAERDCTGAEAFDRYIAHALPHVRESGGDLLFMGAGGLFLIGPEDESWDLVMMVRHRSAETFLSFASNEAYLAGIGHRLAAIEDSRLLPMTRLLLPDVGNN